MTDTDIREALSAIRDVEPTDDDVRRAMTAARPRRARHPRLMRAAVAAGAVAAAATAVVAGLPSSTPERASAHDVLLSAATVAAQQPPMPSDGYRYAKLVRRTTRTSMLRGCATCVGSVTAEQDVEHWAPPQWRDGRVRYGDARIVARSGDEQRQRELIKDGLGFDSPRLLPDPSLQDIPFADLPTDPVALRDLLQAAVLDLRWAGRARDAIQFERDALHESSPQTPQEVRSLLINGVVSMLGDANITPKLRSALFGVLATVDGARALGRVDDPLGRSGEGVAFEEDTDDAAIDYPPSERRIVFDPDTSELLAVSWARRDPRALPVPKAALKDREIGWYSEAWTAYVRTGEVANMGQRP
jgi:hypothetical protein